MREIAHLSRAGAGHHEGHDWYHHWHWHADGWHHWHSHAVSERLIFWLCDARNKDILGLQFFKESVWLAK
jgi:hypothetical protein